MMEQRYSLIIFLLVYFLRKRMDENKIKYGEK